jgi:ribose transport system permease protein
MSAATPGPATVSDPAAVRRARRMKTIRFIREYAVLVALVVLFVGLSLSGKNFLTVPNLLNVLRQASIVGVIALAMTFVFIGGGFDLSVGAIFALGGALAAGLTLSFGVPVAFTVTLLVGGAIGLVNGLVITKVRINPFVTTLGMLQIVGGAALLYTSAKPIRVDDEAFSWLGKGTIAGIPVPAIILVALIYISWFVLDRTRYGRYIFSIGSSSEASRLAGINVDVYRTSTYVLTGVAAAFAGIMFASRISVGAADVGAGIELAAIAAVLVGGTSLLGGEGAIWRTGVGVLFFALLFNGFNLLNVQSFWQDIASGAIILITVGVDAWSRSRR